ncbi:MAG: flagellin [Phycisphaerae bacterium]|nr:flagellin [Phycisphaerae bacterium]
MLAIKNNLMAEGATRHLGLSYEALNQSVQRLSSGLRINTARDDAAGLAVRELMRADIAALRQGVRNAQDAISMMQVAEGALQTVDDIMIRMKELAEQAATGSYNTAQRKIIDEEFQEMIKEIDRIAKGTNFNSLTMLDSATGSVLFHFGPGNTLNIDKINVNTVDVTANTLFGGAMAITTQSAAGAALVNLNSALEYKDGKRAEFGYMMNRMQHTVNVLNIQAENVLAAESRISDVDVASEMTKMMRNQVLAQAGTAMLAQANAMPQMALSLLR